MPTICARPVLGYRRAHSASARAPPDSTHVSPRASARVEPSAIWLARVSTSALIATELSSRARSGRASVEGGGLSGATCSDAHITAPAAHRAALQVRDTI